MMLKQIYFSNGIIDIVDKGTVIIDMTSSPDLAKKIYEISKRKKKFFHLMHRLQEGTLLQKTAL